MNSEKIHEIGKEEEEIEKQTKKEQKLLSFSWPLLKGNAYLQYNEKFPTTKFPCKIDDWGKDLNKLSEKVINLKLEPILYDTCKYFYEKGYDISKTDKIIDIISATVLGTGFSMLFTPFLTLGIIFVSVGLMVILILQIYKKKYAWKKL